MSLAEQLTILRMAGAIVISTAVVWFLLSWLSRLEPERREVVLGYLEICGFVLMVVLAGAYWLFGAPRRG